MSTKYFTVAAFMVAALAGLSSSEPFLVEDSAGFTKRDEIVQGWALVENLCPDGTGGCGKRSCCPYGSYCDDNEATNSNLCCPTRDGCAYDVSKASRCAVSTWVEWFTSKDPICCMPGEIGVQPGPNDYYGYCSSAGSNVASSLLASTVLGPSTAAATTGQTSLPLSTPTASASPSTTTAKASTSSIGSSNLAAASPTKATAASGSPSSAAANVNTSVDGGLSALLGMIGGIMGFLAI